MIYVVVTCLISVSIQHGQSSNMGEGVLAVVAQKIFISSVNNRVLLCYEVLRLSVSSAASAILPQVL